MPTVMVHFPDGTREYPAHIEEDFPVPNQRVPLIHYVPDDHPKWEFRELIDGSWTAHERLPEVLTGDVLPGHEPSPFDHLIGKRIVIKVRTPSTQSTQSTQSTSTPRYPTLPRTQEDDN